MAADGVMKVTKNGRKVWCAYYSFGSGKTRKFIRGFGETEAEARRRCDANLRKHFASGGGAVRKARSPRLSTFMETWLDAYGPDALSDETRRKYRRDLEIHVLPHLNPPIAELTTEALRVLFNQTLHRTAKPSARWNAYKTLRTCLNHAVGENMIGRNPMVGVNKPTLTIKVTDTDDNAIDKRVNTVRYLLEWLADPSNEHHDDYPRILMMFLGLRRSEILGLEWSCLPNLNRKGKASVVVKQQLKRRESGGRWYLYPSTKNGETRTIPLPELWRKALVAEKKKARVSNEPWARNLVFLREDGRHIDYNTHMNSWKRVLTAYINKRRKEKKPLTPEEYWRPHANRHVAASLLSSSGAPLEVAQMILGHSDKATTIYYTHATREEKHQALHRLEGTMGPERKGGQSVKP